MSIDSALGLWQDFSSKNGGDVIDFVAFVEFGSINDSTRIEAAKWLVGDDFDVSQANAYTEQRDSFIRNMKAWHERPLNDLQASEYLHSRRISDDTIERFKMGLLHEY